MLAPPKASLRDERSLLEQGSPYAAEHHRHASRELLGVVPEEILDELTAPSARSRSESLTLVHRLLAEGKTSSIFAGKHRSFPNSSRGASLAVPTPPSSPRPPIAAPWLKQTGGIIQRRRPHAIFHLMHSSDDLRRQADGTPAMLEMALLRFG